MNMNFWKTLICTTYCFRFPLCYSKIGLILQSCVCAMQQETLWSFWRGVWFYDCPGPCPLHQRILGL